MPVPVEHGDVVASLQFVGLLAALVVLPDQEVLFGLNPRRVWLVVVFIAGLSFLGYLLSKLVDTATAIGLTGVLGGAVSPGMTITSLVEQARRYPALAPVYAVAGAAAATMLFPRNLAVVPIVSPSLARSLLAPFAGMAGVGVTVAVVLCWRTGSHVAAPDELDTPFEVRSALALGAVVAAVLVIVETVELSPPADATRTGIVLVTVAQLSAYTGVTWTAGVGNMARPIALTVVGAGSVGVVLVLLV